MNVLVSLRTYAAGRTARGESVADPADPGMLDGAGMDRAVPNLISDFPRGSR